MPNRSIRDDMQKDPPRRKVGDVDPQARKAFLKELRGEVKSAPVKTPEPKSEASSFVTETGRLRTRKERIEYEVESAQKGK